MNLARHYRTLGLRRGADASDVKAAYRKLVRQYHPDINPDEAAIEQFIKINDAYTTLSQAIEGEHNRVTATQTEGSPPDNGSVPIGHTKLDSKLTGLMQTLERMGLGHFSSLGNGSSVSSTARRAGQKNSKSTPTYVAEQPATASDSERVSTPTGTMESTQLGEGKDSKVVQSRSARSLSVQEAALKQEAYEQLKALLQQQKFPRAIALVEGLAHRMPEDSEIVQWQAIVYQRWGRKLIDSGQPQKARIYLKKALRTDPNNPSLWHEINRDFWQLANL